MVHLILLKSLLYMQSQEEKKGRTKKKKKKLLNKKVILCRVCNKKKGNIPIFNNNIQINIAEEIQNFSGVLIQETDNASKYLCKYCLELLDSCIKFRELCRNNNDYFNNIDPIKTEKSITFTESVSFENDNYDYDSTLHINEVNNTEDNKPEHSDFDCDSKTLEIDENYSLPSPTFSEEFKFYNCPNCDQPFPDLEKYNIHILICNGQEVKEVIAEPAPKQRFLCDICGKTISTLATLHIHMKIHKDIFPYHCDECPYRGRTVDLLRVHKRIHLQEKPYKCDLCGKTATTASNLQRHTRNAHSTDRPFKCPQCDRSYRLERDVTKHLREAHGHQRSVTCPMCDKTLSSLNALSKHRLKVHKIKGRNGRMPSYLQCEMMTQPNEDDYT